MKKASELYQKLKIIEELIRRNENPDGSCTFDSDKVYIFLETAQSQIPDEQNHLHKS